MATAEDRAMIGHLRALNAMMQASQGARDFTQVLDRGVGTRDTGMLVTPLNFDRLIIPVYSLKPNAEKPPAEGDKTPAKAVAKAASLTVKVYGFLTETETVLVTADSTTKEGPFTVSLPFLSSRYQVVIECEGTVEYAVFAI